MANCQGLSLFSCAICDIHVGE